MHQCDYYEYDTFAEDMEVVLADDPQKEKKMKEIAAWTEKGKDEVESVCHAECDLHVGTLFAMRFVVAHCKKKNTLLPFDLSLSTYTLQV